MVAGQSPDESRIARPGIGGFPVGFAQHSRNVLAPVVDRLDRKGLSPEIERPAGHLGAADLHALVENHVPARRQVVCNQAHGVDVGRFLHRLADLDQVAPVPGLKRRLGQQKVLPRARLHVFSRRQQKPDAADAQDVADERISIAVPREHQRATGQLALGLGDPVRGRAGQGQLRLEDSIGPVDAHVVDRVGSAQADGDRGEALARTRGVPQTVLHDPAALDPGCDARADSRGVGPGGCGLVIAPAQREQGVAEPARPRPAQRDRAVPVMKDQRGAFVVERSERPRGHRLVGQREHAFDGCPPQAPGRQAMAGRDDEVGSSIAVQIGGGELRAYAVGRARSRDDRGRSP